MTILIRSAVCFLILLSIPALANNEPQQAAILIPEPTVFISEHSGRFNGERVDYLVEAGETYLRDMNGEPKASIFAFSYIKQNVSDDEVRPVTFVWNGGPGSSSVWLHMGAYGPTRIVVPSDAGHAGPPPYDIMTAPETILDVTDLVFIDPVGTGFSRPLGEHEGKEFWGLPEDPQSMAEFILAWTTEHQRWNSPRFLLGESYGTTRAAAVAEILEEDMSVSLNGILFVSQALDYQGSSPYISDNIISFVTYLPTLAATALYHGKVTPQESDQESFLQASRDFANNVYLPALWKGNTITDDEYQRVKQGLIYFTGLSERYIDQVDLRVRGDRFAKELLRDQGLAVGRLDSRYLQDDIDDVASNTEGDAASNAISPAYKAAFMHYIGTELGVQWNRPYLNPADPDVGDQWDWAPEPGAAGWEPRYVNTAHQLSSAMRINPNLQLFVGSGYFDLVTPFYDAEYTLNRHDIPSDRVQYEYYQGGHMMYVYEPARLRLLQHSREFIEAHKE